MMRLRLLPIEARWVDNDSLQMRFAAGPLTRYGAAGGRALRAARIISSHTTAATRPPARSG